MVLNFSSCSDYFHNLPVILPKVENILIFISQGSEHVHTGDKHLVSHDPIMRNIRVILSDEGELSPSQLRLAQREPEQEKNRSVQSKLYHHYLWRYFYCTGTNGLWLWLLNQPFYKPKIFILYNLFKRPLDE